MAQLEASWHKVVRGMFFASVLIVWLSFFLLFFASVSAHNRGVPNPDAAHMIPSRQHGNTVFITWEESRRIRLLARVVFVGLPSLLVAGLISRFGLKIKL